MVQDWGSGDTNRLERVVFADGTAWDAASIQTLTAGLLGLPIVGTADDDSLVGWSGENATLQGLGGNDYLSGNNGNDTLNGGAGNDVYVFGRGYGQDIVSNWDENFSFTDILRFQPDVAPSEVVVSRADDGSYDLVLSISGTEDTLTISGFFDPDYGQYMRIDALEFSNGTVWDVDTLLAKIGGGEDNVVVGTVGDETLTGTAGNDTLQGGAGNDWLAGGDGNDTYLFNPGDGVDQIVDSGGTDTIQFGAGIAPDSLSLGLGSLLVRVGDQGDAIHIEDFNPDDPLHSSAIDTFRFADGTVLDIADLLQRGFNIRGSGGDDLLTGTAINDRITGGEGSDTLAGGKGDDQLSGGGGNDTYLFNLGDGVDTIEDVSSVAAGNLIAFGAGIAASDLAFERDGGDLLIRVGSQGDAVRLKDFDRFGNNGSLVTETLQFADGSRASLFQLANTAPVAAVTLQNQAALEDVAFSFTIPANTFTDVDAGDSLTYTASLSNAAASPSWLSFDAATRTFSGASTAISAGLWNVRVTATDTSGASASDDFVLDIAHHLVGTAGGNTLNGSALRDVIEGLGGDDTINGGAGADTMIGGLGNDIFTVDNTADIVIENAGEGTDLVYTTVSYALGDNIEKLTLSGASCIDGTGNSLNNTIVGNAAANVLYGLAGNDDINGGAGADTMIGGLGNDIFTVDNVADLAIEYSGEGTDRVYASVSYALGDNIENLYFSGASAIDGTGNSANNIIEGNSAANVLYGLAGDDTINGGAGADTMVGGLGNDLFTVDNIADIVIENADEGTDRVYAAISYTLGDNLENLTLTGASVINGTGNSGNNIIVGNVAANILYGLAGNDNIDGGAGADTMIGGLGNDIYYVDNIADLVIENADEGTDRVYTTVSYALSDNTENLTLSGANAIDGTGNNLNNTIVGNAAANILYGMAGNDDMNGGAGDDTYRFTLGDGIDTINNSDAIGFDTVAFGADIGQTSVGLFRNGNNLEIGYSDIDKVSVSNYFANANSMVDEVNLADGSYLSAADINQVIQDIAAYAVNEGIGMNSINDVRHNEQLMNLVISSWHA